MYQVFEASNCKRNTDIYYDKHAFILLTKFNFVKRLRYKEIARQQECVDNVILMRMRYGHLPVLRAAHVQSVSIFSNRFNTQPCFTTIEVHDNPRSSLPVGKKHIIL